MSRYSSMPSLREQPSARSDNQKPCSAGGKSLHTYKHAAATRRSVGMCGVTIRDGSNCFQRHNNSAGKVFILLSACGKANFLVHVNICHILCGVGV